MRRSPSNFCVLCVLLRPTLNQHLETAMKTIKELCDLVRETAYAIHIYHGHRHLEKVYENTLAHRLRKTGLDVRQQHPMTVHDKVGTIVGEYFADLLIDGRCSALSVGSSKDSWREVSVSATFPVPVERCSTNMTLIPRRRLWNCSAWTARLTRRLLGGLDRCWTARCV